MEFPGKDFCRSSDIGQGGWNLREKISYDLRKSVEADGKIVERFPTNPGDRPGEDGKIEERFPSISGDRPG